MEGVKGCLGIYVTIPKEKSIKEILFLNNHICIKNQTPCLEMARMICTVNLINLCC